MAAPDDMNRTLIMKDLEPILNVLCSYQSGSVLSADEVALLSEWLKESEQHRELFKDLGSWTKLYMGNINGNPRESIQQRLIDMEEMGE
jgi:hypothetical protein